MRRAWFCYEAGAKGPVPVIHYDSLPNEKNYLNPKVLQKYDLRARVNEEIDISFAQLIKIYPYTGDYYADGTEMVDGSAGTEGTGDELQRDS